MTARLAVLWADLKSSFWALPMAVVLLAAAAAITALRVRIAPDGNPVWWLYGGDAVAATGFLENMLAAMITMSTLAISITMVVLTLAAATLGPRLIQTFMGDTRTKLALGIFLGTVVYLLLVLRNVVGTDASLPQLAVTLGTALVLTSTLILLFFVHHLARSIVADTVIENVGRSLDAAIRDLLPERTEIAVEPANRIAGADGTLPLAATASGYVQAIDASALASAARQANGLIILSVRTGDFVLTGSDLARVRPDDMALRKAVLGAILIGRDRTPVQDIGYIIRQLVEIALRALSPGINDPHTAARVVDRLAASLLIATKRASPPTQWRDDKNVLRVVLPHSPFASMLEAAYGEIRHAGASTPAILVHLVDRLAQLRVLGNPGHRDAITALIERIGATARTGLADPADRVALEIRIATALDPQV